MRTKAPCYVQPCPVSIGVVIMPILQEKVKVGKIHPRHCPFHSTALNPADKRVAHSRATHCAVIS